MKGPLLIWNPSESVPIGLYAIIRSELRPRRYRPRRSPRFSCCFRTRPRLSPAHFFCILKPVSAVAGERVCRFGSCLLVRHRVAAPAGSCRTRHANLVRLPDTARASSSSSPNMQAASTADILVPCKHGTSSAASCLSVHTAANGLCQTLASALNKIKICQRWCQKTKLPMMMFDDHGPDIRWVSATTKMGGPAPRS